MNHHPATLHAAAPRNCFRANGAVWPGAGPQAENTVAQRARHRGTTRERRRRSRLRTIREVMRRAQTPVPTVRRRRGVKSNLP